MSGLVESLVALLVLTTGAFYLCEAALDCFSCTNLRSIDDCHTIKTCTDTQVCYTESYMSGNTEWFTLGCRETVFCAGIDQTHLFGRDLDDVINCTQCCHLHGCNKYLCPVKFTAAPPPVDGAWSTWGQWGDCNPPCGIGLHFRYRQCDDPAPSSNGRPCVGDTKDYAICNNQPCTVLTSEPPHAPSTSNTPTTTTDPPKTTTKPPCTTTSRPPGTTPDPPVITSHAHSTGKPTTPYMDSGTTTSTQYYTNDLTQRPGHCEDLIDCSSYYRPSSCHGEYSPWAHRYCPVHCGFCPTPSPIPCVDKIANCHEYESDVCTNEDFWQWREAHCRKFCKLC